MWGAETLFHMKPDIPSALLDQPTENKEQRAFVSHT